MNLLVFKLTATPTLILVATLVGRRYGQAIAGWLIGLPLTSGPIAVFLALEHGPAFAQAAASGSLEGTVGQAFFAATYARVAARRGWLASLLAGAAAFVLASVAVSALGLPMPAIAVVAAVSLVGCLRVTGRPPRKIAIVAEPRWDLPARMVVATVLVLLITGVAQLIGPDATGIAATFPLFATVLTVFAHRRQGVAAAQSIVRGLLLGLFGFVAFFVAVALLVTRVDLAAVFAIALAVNLAIHGASLAVLKTSAR